MKSRTLLVLGAISLVLAACSGSEQGAGGEVSVVATTTILGDIAGRLVDCGGGEVRTLIPVGADPHDYTPSSAQMRDMVTADLVVANGLGLEEGLASGIATAEKDGAEVLDVAPLLDPIPLGADEGDHQGGGDGRSLDPHVWLDLTRMASAAEHIGVDLARVTGDDKFTACGEQESARLREVDTQVRAVLDRVPAERRVLITDHRALGYFAAAYGFQVGGVLVPGGSTLAAPSSQHVADLVKVLQDTGVPAIFRDVAQNPTLMDTLAEETGRSIKVVALYVGSVGPAGSGAEDYSSMMLKNADRIADALAAQGAR